MSKLVETFRDALYESGLVQPLSATNKAGSLSCMCRQIPGQEKGWVATIDDLLSKEIPGVDLHTCRRYVKKDGKMAFGWFIGIEAKNSKELSKAVEEYVIILKSASSRFEVAQPQVITATPESQKSQEPGFSKNFNLRKYTDANPRAPEFSPDPVAPKNQEFKAKSFMIETGGSVTIVPLAHVHGDMNKPAPGSNKGAAVMGSSELFKGLNVKR